MFIRIDKHSETRRQHLPDAAAVICLQGKLWDAHKEHNKAVECYVAALKLNPFMWDAFVNLCETGKFRSWELCALVPPANECLRGRYAGFEYLQDEPGIV
jgi:hypothetical protein